MLESNCSSAAAWIPSGTASGSTSLHSRAIAQRGNEPGQMLGGRLPVRRGTPGGGGAAVNRVVGGQQLRQSVELGFPPAALQALSQRLAQTEMPPAQVQRFINTVTRAAHQIRPALAAGAQRRGTPRLRKTVSEGWTRGDGSHITWSSGEPNKLWI